MRTRMVTSSSRGRRVSRRLPGFSSFLAVVSVGLPAWFARGHGMAVVGSESGRRPALIPSPARLDFPSRTPLFVFDVVCLVGVPAVLARSLPSLPMSHVAATGAALRGASRAFLAWLRIGHWRQWQVCVKLGATVLIRQGVTSLPGRRSSGAFDSCG